MLGSGEIRGLARLGLSSRDPLPLAQRGAGGGGGVLAGRGVPARRCQNRKANWQECFIEDDQRKLNGTRLIVHGWNCWQVFLQFFAVFCFFSFVARKFQSLWCAIFFAVFRSFFVAVFRYALLESDSFYLYPAGLSCWESFHSNWFLRHLSLKHILIMRHWVLCSWFRSFQNPYRTPRPTESQKKFQKP